MTSEKLRKILGTKGPWFSGRKMQLLLQDEFENEKFLDFVTVIGHFDRCITGGDTCQVLKSQFMFLSRVHCPGETRTQSVQARGRQSENNTARVGYVAGLPRPLLVTGKTFFFSDRPRWRAERERTSTRRCSTPGRTSKETFLYFFCFPSHVTQASVGEANHS